MASEDSRSFGEATVWATRSSLVQRTVWPSFTVVVAGTNLMSRMATFTTFDGVAVGGGAEAAEEPQPAAARHNPANTIRRIAHGVRAARANRSTRARVPPHGGRVPTA